MCSSLVAAVVCGGLLRPAARALFARVSEVALATTELTLAAVGLCRSARCCCASSPAWARTTRWKTLRGEVRPRFPTRGLLPHQRPGWFAGGKSRFLRQLGRTILLPVLLCLQEMSPRTRCRSTPGWTPRYGERQPLFLLHASRLPTGAWQPASGPARQRDMQQACTGILQPCRSSDKRSATTGCGGTSVWSSTGLRSRSSSSLALVPLIVVLPTVVPLVHPGYRRELSDLVKEVHSAARRPMARLSFAFIYPDRRGKNVMRQVRGNCAARGPSMRSRTGSRDSGSRSVCEGQAAAGWAASTLLPHLAPEGRHKPTWLCSSFDAE
jgi:hypothetical protein